MTRSPHLGENVRENFFEEVTFKLRHKSIRGVGEEWSLQREMCQGPGAKIPWKKDGVPGGTAEVIFQREIMGLTLQSK